MMKNPAKCKYLLLTFYSNVSGIVYMRNCFIQELELENDRGEVETSFLFFIACFYNNNEKPRKIPKTRFAFSIQQLLVEPEAEHMKANCHKQYGLYISSLNPDANHSANV